MEKRANESENSLVNFGLMFGNDTTAKITEWPNGFEVAYYKTAGQAECSSSWINIPGIHLLSFGVQGFLYGAALAYMFVGVAIIADIFMAAVEQICSKTKVVILPDGTTKRKRVWNQTVANLTLMSVGCSAPEIMLSIVETIKTLGQTPSEIGPSTIVGSAAYNLMMINAVCILSLPAGESKSITDVGVFWLTAFWAVGVYVWMYIVLDVWSPGIVTMAEAWITLCCMGAFVGSAYCQSKNWFRMLREVPSKDVEATASAAITMVINPAGSEVFYDCIEHDLNTMCEEDEFGMNDQPSAQELEEDIRNALEDATPSMRGGKSMRRLFNKVGERLGAIKTVSNRSNLWYRVNMGHKLTGRRYMATKEEIEHSKAAGKGASGAKTQFGFRNACLSELPETDYDSVEGSARAIFGECRVAFTASEFKVLENEGIVRLAVRRYGDSATLKKPSVVEFSTHDGSAVAPNDFDIALGELVFSPNETTKHIPINIIANEGCPIPNRSFTVSLSNHRVKDDKLESCISASASKSRFILGSRSLTQVTIIDTEDQGVLCFESASKTVLDSNSTANIKVIRNVGARSIVTVDYYTTDGSAVADIHYQAVAGTLQFEAGVTSREICVPLLKCQDESWHNGAFHITLHSPTNQATLGKQVVSIVHVKHDDRTDKVISNLMSMFMNHRQAFYHSTESWYEQLIDAMQPQGGVDDLGNELGLKFDDYLMHYLAIFWKLLFCLVPPTSYCGGWVTFFVSLGFIAFVTAVIGELASLFGCSVGLKDSVTAITFVALGTSLPDTFASMNAAREADDADAAISNANGTTTNNVLLGLGLPWVIGAIYSAAHGRPYCVPSGSLAFSVIVFSCCAVLFMAVTFLRRRLVGAELGGPSSSRIAAASFLTCLWLSYVVLSSLEAYGYISFGERYMLDQYGCRLGPA